MARPLIQDITINKHFTDDEQHDQSDQGLACRTNRRRGLAAARTDGGDQRGAAWPAARAWLAWVGGVITHFQAAIRTVHMGERRSVGRLIEVAAYQQK